jgi:hypothetical protein
MLRGEAFDGDEKDRSSPPSPPKRETTTGLWTGAVQSGDWASSLSIVEPSAEEKEEGC